MRRPISHPWIALALLVALLPADLALVRHDRVRATLDDAQATVQGWSRSASAEADLAVRAARCMAVGTIAPSVLRVTRDALAMTPWRASALPALEAVLDRGERVVVVRRCSIGTAIGCPRTLRSAHIVRVIATGTGAI